MLRQNRSEGSSTSRSFAKTALLQARRKTFQFSDKQFAPAHFLYGTTFPHHSLFRPRSRSQALPEVRYFFRRNHFPSCRPAEPVRLEAATEVGFARGPQHSFRGNHFSSFLPAEIGCPETPADRTSGNHCTFFEGTTFPPSFRPRLAQQEATTLG
jgi:hypothetical protein